MKPKLYDKILNCCLYKSGEWFTTRDLMTLLHVCKSETEINLRTLVEDNRMLTRKEVAPRAEKVTYYFKSNEKIRSMCKHRLSKGPKITYAEAHINPWILNDIRRISGVYP